jgi:2'-5' RNA ligase
VKKHRIFGVVVMAPPDLSRWVNRVRRFYDPNFSLIAPHVTVLPPRPLALSREEVVKAVTRVAGTTPSLHISLDSVGTFDPVMPVIFLRLTRGRRVLTRLHRRLSRGRLRSSEAFPYVPHLTLGQDLDDARFRRALALSRQLFSNSFQQTHWRADSLVVVERRTEYRWASLPPVPLGGSRRRSR